MNALKKLSKILFGVACLGVGLFVSTGQASAVSGPDPTSFPTSPLCTNSINNPKYWLLIQALYKIRGEDGRLVAVTSCGWSNCRAQVRRQCDGELILTQKMAWPNLSRYVLLPRDKYEVKVVDDLKTQFTPTQAMVNLDRDNVLLEFAAEQPLIPR